MVEVVPYKGRWAQFNVKLHFYFSLQVYEEIAGHFSDTRHTMWPQVASFLQNLPDGAVVADIGCGNGKYLAGDQNRLFKVLLWNGID